MQKFEFGGVRLSYLERGNGFPVLLFAPGGMRSAASFWKSAPWNPVDVLADEFRVIAMDQRNAGSSTAPIRPSDGWDTYTRDHISLLDHLGIERCHVVGGCIGGSYALGLIEAAPERVTAAVLQQPIGRSAENQRAFYDMFDGWASALAEHHPAVSAADWAQFRSRMYDGDFVFNVTREAVSSCPTPLLVLMGNDLYHPEAISREIASLAPRAELIEHWKDATSVAAAVARVQSFLRDHTPSS